MTVQALSGTVLREYGVRYDRFRGHAGHPIMPKLFQFESGITATKPRKMAVFPIFISNTAKKTLKNGRISCIMAVFYQIRRLMWRLKKKN